MARKMKDSGIEWIGEIPEGWTCKRGKQLFVETNERSKTGSEELLTVSHLTGVTPRSQKNVNMFMSESLVDYKVCHPGDLAANTMWMWQGAIGVSRFHGVISPSYNTYRQRTINYISEYLDYLLRIRPLVDTYNAYSTGITLSRLRLYPQSFLSIHFIVPPMDEQQKIATYLDVECSRIDAMLAKTRDSIEEYKKLKQAVITQAVTKGVRGEREMKDSGVEWIGEIPAEWSITKIKSGVTKIGSGKTPSGGAETYTDSGVIFLRSQNVYDCTLNLESPTYISPEVDATMKSTRVLPDDVLLNITGGSIGRCSIVPKTLGLANVNQHVCIIRTNPLIFLPKYMQYFWVSTLGHLAIDLYQTGGNREGMSADAIRNTPIPYAPLNEQKEIADYLDAKCAEIDGLIAKKEQLVKELESYKKSLIYEVVTGKREV